MSDNRDQQTSFHLIPQPGRGALLLRRLAALSYDLLVMTGGLMIATFPYLGILYWTTGAESPDAGDPLFRLYVLLLVLGYVWLSWRRGGQTIGMKAWRLRAETLDGHLLSHRQIMLRFFAGVPAVLLFGLGYLWSLWSPQGQTLHEYLSYSRTTLLPKR
ncbi:MAG: RDD family protein [Natronospirillum sp.]|uniref:RDD family protein n=1 Tax=Natronospirillum sp. TaxID=2812955 RepID=UPI0025F6DD25|nr:RDD family protein [Natronospirillum sp.]MCH8551191.1 RDD family protein [Natronospirillum sp.]